MWKTCPVCDAYLISDDGDVMRADTGKILKQKLDKDNHLSVNLSFGGRGAQKFFLVHRLVAKAFIPNPENKPYISHIDGNILNNCAKNLRWVDTIERSYEYCSGSDTYNAKFTEEQIKYCRGVYKPRDKQYGCSALAEKFGVAKSTMSYVLNNKTYNK
jgi:hypothetical protein